MKITFLTAPYEIGHGKLPKGRGIWAFSTTSRPKPAEVYHTGDCTLTEAKKDAAAYFQRGNMGRNYLTLFILA